MYYGQSEQDRFIHEKYFLDKRNGISIECGAFDGVMESATYFFEESMGWSAINIEASPPIYNMLDSNRKKSININKGLSNKKGNLIFNHAIHPQHGVKFGNGSFNHKESHIDILKMENCTFESYEVETIPYRDLIDVIMDQNFNGRTVDLFVLDVEGFEVEVLDGMVGSKYLPNIFCIEYPHVGLDKLQEILVDLGYRFDTINETNAYFIKNDTNI
jgi:FkbM family methyltransferase